MFSGNVFRASIVYLLADVVWIYLSWLSGNTIGLTLVIIGSLLGFGTFLRMYFGKLRKDLWF